MMFMVVAIVVVERILVMYDPSNDSMMILVVHV
jgi:hypothetical protein